MAAILADALLQSARVARDLLTPLTAPNPVYTDLTGRTDLPASNPASTSLTDLPVPVSLTLTQELQARIEAVRDETLEYHRTHRPSNTVKNYAPKQREWKAWCAAQGFPPGGQYLPGDWVDEGKLLLFIKEEVAIRTPRKGSRLTEEKERKRKAKLHDFQPFKRQKGNNQMAVTVINHLIVKGEDDDEQSDLVFMYNTVRGYVFIIKELWSIQTSQGLHNAL